MNINSSFSLQMGVVFNQKSTLVYETISGSTWIDAVCTAFGQLGTMVQTGPSEE